MKILGDRRFWIGFAAGIVLACVVLVPLGYYFASTLAVDNIEQLVLQGFRPNCRQTMTGV